MFGLSLAALLVWGCFFLFIAIGATLVIRQLVRWLKGPDQ